MKELENFPVARNLKIGLLRPWPKSTRRKDFFVPKQKEFVQCKKILQGTGKFAGVMPASACPNTSKDSGGSTWVPGWARAPLLNA